MISSSCKNIIVCAVCGKPYGEHGTYPTCATHPYTADDRCGHVGTYAGGIFTGATCPGSECKNGCVRAAATPPSQTYEQPLRCVLNVVQRYLPPGGLSKEEALSEIIAIVDPWPDQTIHSADTQGLNDHG